MKIKTKLKGCAAEHYAVYHFQKQGLYVFKSNQTHCPIDLITLDPETRTMELWDVKCAAHRKDGTHINRTKRKSAKDLNVKIIYYEKGKVFTKPSRKRTKNKKV